MAVIGFVIEAMRKSVSVGIGLSDDAPVVVGGEWSQGDVDGGLGDPVHVDQDGPGFFEPWCEKRRLEGLTAEDDEAERQVLLECER